MFWETVKSMEKERASSQLPTTWIGNTVTTDKSMLINNFNKHFSMAGHAFHLAKVFDSVNQRILIGRLNSLGFSNDCLAWFTNYFSDRVQCVKWGCHRVQFLGRLFSMYISMMSLLLLVIL